MTLDVVWDVFFDDVATFEELITRDDEASFP